MWNPEHINNALLDERSGKLESDEFKQVCNHCSQAHHMLLILIMSLIAFADCTRNVSKKFITWHFSSGWRAGTSYQ